MYQLALNHARRNVQSPHLFAVLSPIDQTKSKISCFTSPSFPVLSVDSELLTKSGLLLGYLPIRDPLFLHISLSLVLPALIKIYWRAHSLPSFLHLSAYHIIIRFLPSGTLQPGATKPLVPFESFADSVIRLICCGNFSTLVHTIDTYAQLIILEPPSYRIALVALITCCSYFLFNDSTTSQCAANGYHHYC